MTIDPSVVENVGVATGISGLRVAILVSVVGHRQAVVIIVLDNVGMVTRTQALSKMCR